MKNKANQGFMKQVTKSPTPQPPKQPFNYSKPVTKVSPVQNMAVNSRNREFKSVKEDKSTNFAVEQNGAKQSHKGK